MRGSNYGQNSHISPNNFASLHPVADEINEAKLCVQRETNCSVVS